MIEYLSDRGKKWVKTLPPLVKAHFDNFYNMYDKENNPNGLINMGTAESHLVNQEICDLLDKAAQRLELKGAHIHYNKFEGSEEFRTAIANYWQKVIFKDSNAPVITQNHVATCTGCTVALENLATLLAEPGDVFLIPAPYYSSFVDDIGERAGVIAVGVPCSEDLNRDALEQAYIEQTTSGKRVRAVLFSSPNNPLGVVYKEEELRGLIAFAMDHNLDLISDEIYAQTVFDPEATFISALSLTPKEYLHRVHVTSSFAKDFVLSGFKTGLCISFNPYIIQGISSLAYYSPVSTHTQAILTELLQEPKLPEVLDLSRQRLFSAYQLVTEGFHQLGIATKKAQAGIFVFADFSPYLQKQEFAEEHVLWEKIYNQAMINISPGQLFEADKPGWFRACYALSEDAIEETCRRLANYFK